MENEANDELLMTLVESALDRPPNEREGYLQSACGDSEILAEVRKRLEWEERMAGFLQEPLVARKSPFEPGTRIADRFVILREIGHGGMGVVYEALDEQLDRKIALKCAKPGYRNRLPPEARAAREVSHFNVCKVHDLHSAPTPMGDVQFLSMEFIEGETLEQRIRRDGPLPEKDAREIALQICAGLEQAHRQGVIHGDLKTANVILAHTQDGGVRAVITDFGLAKMKQPDGARVDAGGQGGTLSYMAPELFYGARSSVASDIYAFGVLTHLILTGRAPQRSVPSGFPKLIPTLNSTSDTITILFSGKEPEWKNEIEELPKPWLRIVTQCLATQPEKRPASGGEISAAFRPASRISAWAGVAVALLVALLAFVWQTREKPVGPSIRLAMLPFTVEGPPIPVAAGVGQDVADRLSGVKRGLFVIPPQEVLRNRVDTREKAKSMLGATHVLQTRLRERSGQIEAQASLIDAASGLTLRQLQGAYPTGRTDTLSKALLATITGGLGLRAGVALETVGPPAYQEYVQGTALLRRDDQSAEEALKHLEKAQQLDPMSALPLAALAEAMLAKFKKGDGRHWLDQSGQLVAKAKGINSDSVPVLLVSGRYQQEHGSYEQAIREYTRATELEPGNSEAWRRLAVLYEQMNRPDAAITAYNKAIEAQPNYYRHYLDFGNLYLYRGMYPEAEGLYRRMLAFAPSFATGHMNLGLVLMQQGRYPEAEKELKTAMQLNRTPLAAVNLGGLYYFEERYSEALALFEESLSASQPSAVRYKNLGDAYLHLGRAAEARAAFQNARTVVEEEVSRQPQKAYSHGLLGLICARLGDEHTAEFELSQALALDPENTMVKFDAAVAYELLHQREKTLAVLRDVPRYMIEQLNRQPDVGQLQRDARFRELLQKK